MKRKFAVFDIDGTFARTSIFLQLVHKLIKEGHLPQAVEAELQQKQEAYKIRAHKGAYKEYSMSTVRILVNNLSSLQVSDYRKLVDDVIPQIQSYVYTFSRDLAKTLRKKGYFLIALSGSEMYSVNKFMDIYDFDVIIGEEYLQKNGKFTGEIVKVAHNKKPYIKKLIDEHNLSIIDSIAIGDSMGDIDMLNLVQNPIAFNPEDSLFEAAKSNSWKIVVERKNVIYNLEMENGKFILA